MPSDTGSSQTYQSATQAGPSSRCQLEASPCGSLSTDTLMTPFSGSPQPSLTCCGRGPGACGHQLPLWPLLAPPEPPAAPSPLYGHCPDPSCPLPADPGQVSPGCHQREKGERGLLLVPLPLAHHKPPPLALCCLLQPTAGLS